METFLVFISPLEGLVFQNLA